MKQLDGDVESIFARLGELESGEAKAAAAEILERRLIALEDQNREAKAREVAKPETFAVVEVEPGETKVFEKQSFERRFLALEDQVKCATENLTSDFLCLRNRTEAAFEEAKAKARLDWNSLRKQRLDQTGGVKAAATEVL